MGKSDKNTVELDVRPYMKKKLEPFQVIMDAVKGLEKDDIFVLHATFKPTPLLGLMKTKGFVNKTKKLAEDHWVTTFVSKKNKHLLADMPEEEAKTVETASNESETPKSVESKVVELDNRRLEPPQPMIRTLSALDQIQPGDKVIIHNDRVPVFLIEELNNLGYPFKVEGQSDGSAKVEIQKM